MRKPRSQLILALIASAVLFWVLDLSSPGSTLIDWLVIGLVIAAILWNHWHLGRRLQDAAGLSMSGAGRTLALRVQSHTRAGVSSWVDSSAVDFAFV